MGGIGQNPDLRGVELPWWGDVLLFVFFVFGVAWDTIDTYPRTSFVVGAIVTAALVAVGRG